MSYDHDAGAPGTFRASAGDTVAKCEFLIT